MQNSGIIRNRRKIEAAVTNTKAFLEVQKEFGSFNDYIWSFTQGKPMVNKRKNTRDSCKHKTSPQNQQRSKKQGVQICWSNHHLLPHAGNRNDQQPHNQLLQIQRSLNPNLSYLLIICSRLLLIC
ncbi:hypothetical protein ES705_36243 [subsurface metagenome]